MMLVRRWKWLKPYCLVWDFHNWANLHWDCWQNFQVKFAWLKCATTNEILQLKVFVSQCGRDTHHSLHIILTITIIFKRLYSEHSLVLCCLPILDGMKQCWFQSGRACLYAKRPVQAAKMRNIRHPNQLRRVSKNCKNEQPILMTESLDAQSPDQV